MLLLWYVPFTLSTWAVPGSWTSTWIHTALHAGSWNGTQSRRTSDRYGLPTGCLPTKSWWQWPTFQSTDHRSERLNWGALEKWIATIVRQRPGNFFKDDGPAPTNLLGNIFPNFWSTYSTCVSSGQRGFAWSVRRNPYARDLLVASTCLTH
jgi:hypothetical protein